MGNAEIPFLLYMILQVMKSGKRGSRGVLMRFGGSWKVFPKKIKKILNNY